MTIAMSMMTMIETMSADRAVAQTDAQLQPVWHWQQHLFRAMNTHVHVWLYSQTETKIRHVQATFARIERRLSRFDTGSELSQFNDCTSDQFRASPDMFEAVQAAIWAAQATSGIYDPTILDSLERAGYDRSFEQIKTSVPYQLSETENLSEAPAAPRLFSYRDITLNVFSREISRPPGLRLDLGGMGKGWAVDRAADRLQGTGPFLINAGGDLFAYDAPDGGRGWTIDLVQPLRSGLVMASLRLKHQALATSTIVKRRWSQNGRFMHHLIDPRTGQPAVTDSLSISVTAERAVLAEIYAKVALILGAEAGMDYLQTLPGVEGLIYTANAEIHYTGGMAAILERVEPDGYLN